MSYGGYMFILLYIIGYAIMAMVLVGLSAIALGVVAVYGAAYLVRYSYGILRKEDQRPEWRLHKPNLTAEKAQEFAGVATTVAVVGLIVGVIIWVMESTP